MILKEILQKIVESGNFILLSDSEKDWKASDLLNGLSERTLKTCAHHQQGMYIAEINDAGYLGRVIYRVKQKV
ncbi:hypothetical protein GWO43_12785 [candidate division KSB1 bacterium]|nr:hypothetical protein [candidate division KSB1 bacterium]NIR71300.1 hypothetical protein [candidate division KSB1 bacterium]NIS24528.1 hypothetical protein [candidate division KSB1 bacterium]NIT71735.1 hypothetical protein [candidate division KSB1 bacterium]NIU25137.1 hypothetical protein [candidate division KSB1 bacterium]